MNVSYVLRLRQPSLRAGQFTGEIESVATGHSFPVASLSQLVAYVLETAEEDAAALAGRQGALEPTGWSAAVEPAGRRPAIEPVYRRPAVEP
ncbi:MAG TPA: hypothetical protein VIX85_12575 [Acidimicrobiales bacterium]